MSTNIEKYKKDLNELTKKSGKLLIALLDETGYLKKSKENDELIKKSGIESFKGEYESWYAEAISLIEIVLPNRLEDFKLLYKNDKRKEIDYLTYTISDYMIGLIVTRGQTTKADANSAIPKFRQQINILNSVRRRFESSLFDIQQLLQADLFDSELESAEELLKKGFLRGAGAIAGVVLEKHLKQVISNHKLKIIKKKPTISDYNDLLKKDGVIETPNWRFIQHLGDLRNLCDHDKEIEPTKEQIIGLIEGVEKVTKTIF